MRKKINCCEDFFFHINNGFQGVFWWGHRCTQKHTHPHTSTHIHTILTLHHHANPACFTRQETEGLIVIPQGSADLSQICLCFAPHSTSFLYCLAPRNLKISHLLDLLEMWEICEWSPLPGGFLTHDTGKSKGKAEQRWRRRQKAEGFTLFQAPGGYKAKAVLILRENAGFGYCSVTVRHWRRSEENSWLSPWRKHVSLLERPELINKLCPVSSSLSHRRKSCLDLF